MSDVPRNLSARAAQHIKERDCIEMTPEQVAAHRRSAYAKLREHMRARGYVVPDGDLEFMEWMQRVMRQGGAPR